MKGTGTRAPAVSAVAGPAGRIPGRGGNHIMKTLAASMRQQLYRRVVSCYWNLVNGREDQGGGSGLDERTPTSRPSPDGLCWWVG